MPTSPSWIGCAHGSAGPPRQRRSPSDPRPGRQLAFAMRPALLFDLDGTLVDSIELIMRSMHHAFDGHPGHVPTDDEWRARIGRPLADSFREFVANEPEVDRLIGRYREYQLAHHDRLLRAYDGIVEAIRRFAAAGHPMALVTSKADWLAARALAHVGLDDMIPVVVGCD